ncbi:MAG: cytosine methyltransferase [Oscillospiraceae bacterium]|jgi:N6-adenosine-specific RNA methylase IME4|nr:cytosine methyltransferase [Oscillospiraceae bacterium]
MEKQEKKYATILADPPWDIEQKGERGASRHYKLMNLERIKAMPIADLMKENGHIWLWVTNATLEHGFEILRAWGAVPRSVFTWVKSRMGLGVYLRNATEHVILGTRGKAPIQFKAQMNWGFFPLQNHSHKPEEFHKIVERCSPGPYLELFARRWQPDWDIWGLEAPNGSDIDIPGYPVPNSPATPNVKKI